MLSKEELVIEFVAARSCMGNYAESVSRTAYEETDDYYFEEKYLIPGRKWGQRICRYMWEHRDENDRNVNGSYLTAYGVDRDYGVRLFFEMCENGVMEYPEEDERSPYYDEYNLERIRGLADLETASIKKKGDWKQLMELPREMIEDDLRTIQNDYRKLRASMRILARTYDDYRWLDTPATEYIGKVKVSSCKDYTGYLERREISERSYRSSMKRYRKMSRKEKKMYGSPKERCYMARRASAMLKDIPRVGYHDRNGHLVVPRDEDEER